jgi:hypothetical protein
MDFQGNIQRYVVLDSMKYASQKTFMSLASGMRFDTSSSNTSIHSRLVHADFSLPYGFPKVE